MLFIYAGPYFYYCIFLYETNQHHLHPLYTLAFTVFLGPVPVTSAALSRV